MILEPESSLEAGLEVGDRDVALANTIVRIQAGSTLFGLDTAASDRDEMGIYVEQPEQVLGLALTAEHYVTHTQPVGVRSGAGDVDAVLYSLRKYVRLAMAGNPTVVSLLYAPPRALISSSVLAEELMDLAPSILSVHTGHRFLGYLEAQRERLTGGGRQSRVPKRPELQEAYGYDTKYASHALRLGLQGLEVVRTGALTLPMPEEARTTVMEVKTGQVGYDEALARIDATRDALRAAIDSGTSPLSPEPDWLRVNAWLVHAHQYHWGWTRD